MELPDINVPITAHREDAADHDAYAQWLVSDAYLASLAIEHGCELITTDGDFARFPGLRWRHPLASRG